LILSSVIFFGWWYIQSRLSRGPADSVSVNGSPAGMVAPAPGQTSTPAPAGLVLYWMVSNLVGVAQQFVINRLNPAPVNLQPR
jgi:hypothetical protein